MRGELETGTGCYILTTSSSNYSSTSSSFCWWGCRTGVLRTQALCLELVLTPRATVTGTELQLELKLTQTVSGTWLYNCLISTCFLWVLHLHRIQHIHRSRWYSDVSDRMHLFLDWRLGRMSICYRMSGTERNEKKARRERKKREKEGERELRWEKAGLWQAWLSLAQGQK